MSLIRLVYASESRLVDANRRAELDSILASARRFNDRNGITGFLFAEQHARVLDDLKRPRPPSIAIAPDIRARLAADELVPYLGPALIGLDGPAPVPATPEAVAAELHKRAPAPGRIRTSMWSVAQFIESRRHRKTLQAFMADIFATPVAPNRLHAGLAALPLSLIVDTWYEGAMAAGLRHAGRADFAEIQGVTRAGEFRDIWTRTYDPSGAEILPEGADPLDVRYNVVNWVNRATRDIVFVEGVGRVAGRDVIRATGVFKLMHKGVSKAD